MPDTASRERRRDERHHHQPRLVPIETEFVVHVPRDDHEQPGSEDRARVPAHALNAGVLRLHLRRQRGHVDGVGRDVLRAGSKTDDPKQADRQREIVRQMQRQPGEHRRDGHQKFHRDDPPLLGLEGLHERRPKRFQNPRQVHQAGVERDFFNRHAQVLVHDRRHLRNGRVRDAHGQVERRHPEHRVSHDCIEFLGTGDGRFGGRSGHAVWLGVVTQGEIKMSDEGKPCCFPLSSDRDASESSRRRASSRGHMWRMDSSARRDDKFSPRR